MKNIKKRFSSIITLLLVFIISLTLVFAAACKDNGDDDSTSSSSSSSSASETVGESSISFTDGSYTADIITGTGTTTQIAAGDADGFVTAVKAASAGDVIELAAGTYKVSSKYGSSSDSGAILISTSGSYDAYITIKAAEGAEGKVIFDFSEMEFDSTNRGIQINGSYWYVYGICVTGAGDNGMYIGGNCNVIENCQFYNNRDTGLQLGRGSSGSSDIADWPSYNLIKNCTSYNNYDNETYGENADGFAAKLTVGYGNVFDGCIAYRNSDDGWDLYAYADNGDIGAVIIYNCVAFENGYLMTTQKEFNDSCNFRTSFAESNTDSYKTRDGDGNGFKLGGSVMRGNVKLYNCLAFNNRMHGVTDNSNPGILNIEGVTSYNNGAAVDDDSTSDTFGYMVTASVDDEYGNFNTARTSSSYNNYKDNLSIADEYRSPVGEDSGLLGDDFLGSAQNSVFYMGNDTYNYIGSAADASSYDSGKVGSKVTGWIATTTTETATTVAETSTTEDENEGKINSAQVFEELPYYKTTKYYNSEGTEVESTTEGATAKSVYVYNITGLNNTSIHSTYRNSDGSINMGDMLAIKKNSKAAELGVGAYLSESSWSAYTHYYEGSVSATSSSIDATLFAIYNTLYLYCNSEAVYQDFILTTKMTGATIVWASSNSSVIEIGKSYNNSNSSSQDVDAIVYRPAEDTQVTLTATITYNGKTTTKAFTVTVKADEPTLGTLSVSGVEDGRILVDQYEAYTEPELTVGNGADYNGKTLASGTYTVESIYEYATSVTAAYSKVGAFTTSAAGVYRITKIVTLADGSDSATYSYYIYVASNDAEIDFTDGAGTLNVYSQGYKLSGDLTNIKGTIYAYSTTTALDLSAYTTEAAKAAYIATLEGVESHDFNDSSIEMEFTNSNSAAYTVYYWFTNGNGVVTSDVHTKNVSIVNVASTSDFDSMLSSASNSSATTTIYLLTADIDFANAAPSNYGKSFYGLLNGGGHTVSNISITSSSSNSGLFASLYGGTIMNIRFLNYTYSGASGSGLIGRSFGGYIYQVALENASITGTDRVGGLIGLDAANTTYISEVSVTGAILSNGNRAGGIIGHMQLNSSYSSVRAEISDCYVSAKVTATGSYVGGVVARFDDTSAAYSLTITHCYVTGDIVCAGSYAGGVIGGQSGSYGSVTIYGCAFLGSITYKGAVLTESVKNSSGIFGRYAQYAPSTVTNCFSTLNEYFSEYTENVSTAYGALHRLQYWEAMEYDIESLTFDEKGAVTTIWTYLAPAAGETTYASAPYVVLTFLQTNGWDDAVITTEESTETDSSSAS